jgi:hypothetical protein
MNRSPTTIVGNTQVSTSQIVEDDNNADWDERRDTTIHYPSSEKVPTENRPSCEDLLESSLMDRKPSAHPKGKKPCEAKSVLLHGGSFAQDHSHRISSFSPPESLKSMLHRPPRQWDRFQVELLPGHYVPLIGTEETMHAFCEDNVIHIECSSCQLFLYCKRTAEMVMCPGCRMISPIDEVDEVGLEAEGLGLGLSVAAAFEMLES